MDQTEPFNPSQTTNFKLFQTERVCRRQFKISSKWQKVLQMGGKPAGKGEIARYEQFLLFPQCFQKDLYCRHVKPRACSQKG